MTCLGKSPTSCNIQSVISSSFRRLSASFSSNAFPLGLVGTNEPLTLFLPIHPCTLPDLQTRSTCSPSFPLSTDCLSVVVVAPLDLMRPGANRPQLRLHLSTSSCSTSEEFASQSTTPPPASRPRTPTALIYLTACTLAKPAAIRSKHRPSHKPARHIRPSWLDINPQRGSRFYSSPSPYSQPTPSLKLRIPTRRLRREQPTCQT